MGETADLDDLLADACTLPTPERPLRLAEFDALFGRAARAVVRDRDRARIHLVGGPGLRAQVLDLTARESACCSFFGFEVEGGDADLTLEVTVPPGRRDVLEALADRAQELCS